MRNFLFSLFLFSFFSAIGQPFITRYERSGGIESPTYPEIIAWWKALDAASPIVKMMEMGPTDSGYPLHLIIVSADKNFDLVKARAQEKNIIFVNNGIHPGEPDGIDATMLLARDMVQGQFKLPSNIVFAFIPVYNIGGALNRSKNYRIDQNGPVEKGFRGNAQNLDLNRDFIKMDSKNAMTFAKIFHYLDPDIFIDNHVSNGADYQHIMTLLTSQHNKLGGVMGTFMKKTFEPALYSLMKKKGFDLLPYVNHFGDTPDGGWPEFYDGPRYGSGYGTLWNTFSFVPETHMLKPYKQRVEATKALMECFLEFTAQQGKTIRELRAQTVKTQKVQIEVPLAWQLDRSQWSEITFKGFAATRKPSEVSGLPRLYYDRSKPYEKRIPFYNYYRDTVFVQRPQAYIIPQGWWKVIERLQANTIQMDQLTKDTVIQVEVYRVESYQSAPKPYEGHHLNRQVQVTKMIKPISFRKGDYYIPLSQKGSRFLMEVLEPQAEDSYFAWNFFDPILGQKEGFSDYVFEETAAKYLKEHPSLKQQLEQKKQTDTAFAKNGSAQLAFVYQLSPYYEPSHNLYPVYRVPAMLPTKVK